MKSPYESIIKNYNKKSNIVQYDIDWLLRRICEVKIQLMNLVYYYSYYLYIQLFVPGSQHIKMNLNRSWIWAWVSIACKIEYLSVCTYLLSLDKPSTIMHILCNKLI